MVTAVDTRATNLPEGAERPSILIRGPCVRKSRKSEKGTHPKQRCEKLEPPPDFRIVIPHFAKAFERLLIREDVKLRAPYVASKAFDDPDNAASFQVKRGPVPIRIERSAADI